MLTWMGSLLGLIRLNVMGHSSFGRFIIRANLVTLAIANIRNLYQAFDPNANTILYWVLNLFWPTSMLMAGILVARVGTLRGWRRYVPLAVGLWLPLTALLGKLMGIALGNIEAQAVDSTQYVLVLSGVYASIGWCSLAYLIWSTPEPQPMRQIEAIPV